MNVVTGKKDSPTPVLSDRMKYVVFSPYWNIPPDIAQKEIAAQGREGSRLSRDATTSRWTRKAAATGSARAKATRSGWSSSSFRTTSTCTCTTRRRTRCSIASSATSATAACALERPIDLAKYVLRDQPEWTEEKIGAAMNAGVEKTVDLKEPLPIYLAYFTAWEENGALKTVPDVYGRDRRHDGGCRIPMTYARHALVVFAVWSAAARAADTPLRKYDTKTASFAITLSRRNIRVSRHLGRRHAGRRRSSSTRSAVRPATTRMKTNDGTLVQQGLRQWRWTAPGAPGTYKLTFDGPGEKDAIKVHAFVMVPATAGEEWAVERLSHRRVPGEAAEGQPDLPAAAGFIEVTKDNQDTKVSPHFTLKQFLCKEDTTRQFPKYIVLQGAAAAEARGDARARQRARTSRSTRCT